MPIHTVILVVFMISPGGIGRAKSPQWEDQCSENKKDWDLKSVKKAQAVQLPTEFVVSFHVRVVSFFIHHDDCYSNEARISDNGSNQSWHILLVLTVFSLRTTAMFIFFTGGISFAGRFVEIETAIAEASGTEELEKHHN